MSVVGGWVPAAGQRPMVRGARCVPIRMTEDVDMGSPNRALSMNSITSVASASFPCIKKQRATGA